MTIHIWPDLLPCFQISGHSYKQENTIQRSQFSSGRTRSRRLYEAVPQYFKVTAKLDNQQLEILEAWLHYKVKDVEWMSVPIRTAAGLNNQVVKLQKNDFDKKYLGGGVAGSPKTGLWSVTLELESQQQDYMSEADLDALL